MFFHREGCSRCAEADCGTGDACDMETGLHSDATHPTTSLRSMVQPFPLASTNSVRNCAPIAATSHGGESCGCGTSPER